MAVLGPSVSVLWEGRRNEEDRPQDEREAAGQAVLRGRITLSPTQGHTKGHTASVNESEGQSPGLPSLGGEVPSLQHTTSASCSAGSSVVTAPNLGFCGSPRYHLEGFHLRTVPGSGE